MSKDKQELERLRSILRYYDKRVRSTIFETEGMTNLNILKNSYEPLIESQKIMLAENARELRKYIPNLDRIIPLTEMDIYSGILMPSNDVKYCRKFLGVSSQKPQLFIDGNGAIQITCYNGEYDEKAVSKMIEEEHNILENIILTSKNNPLNRKYKIHIDNMFFPNITIDRAIASATDEYSSHEEPIVWYRFVDDEYYASPTKIKRSKDEICASVNQIFDYILIPYEQIPEFVKESTVETTEIIKKINQKKGH